MDDYAHAGPMAKRFSASIQESAEFGYYRSDEVIHDLIMNTRDSEGYSDSKGNFSARKAIMQYCQLKNFLI